MNWQSAIWFAVGMAAFGFFIGVGIESAGASIAKAILLALKNWMIHKGVNWRE